MIWAGLRSGPLVARYAGACAAVWLALSSCSDPVDSAGTPSSAGDAGDAAAGGSFTAGGTSVTVSGMGGAGGEPVARGGAESSDGGNPPGPTGGAGAGSGVNEAGAGGDPLGDGGAAGAANQQSFVCIERGSACSTLDDCLVGQVCVNGACAAGKPLGDPCTDEEYCGRDVRCVEGACTYKYSLVGFCGPDPLDPFSVGPDPWLACPIGQYCGEWASFNSGGPTCGAGKDNAWCQTEPCAPGYYCRESGVYPIDAPDYRCKKRIPLGSQSCEMLAPEECEAGLVCNWVLSPAELDAHDPKLPIQTWGCVPPGKEGDYCDPLYPYAFYYPGISFPSECGPNLYCDDDAAANSNVAGQDPFGRCVPLPEPTVQFCKTTSDCPNGQACKDFLPGFLTCGTLGAQGAFCNPNDRYPCAEGLECLRPTTTTYGAPRFGVCTRRVDLGKSCGDKATICADDGACVVQ